MQSIVQINITGENSPDHIDKLLQTLSAYTITILDINQAVVYESFSLSLLVELPSREEDHETVLKDVLYQSHNLGLHMEFRGVSSEEYEGWLRSRRQKRYTLTILGPTLTARHIAGITELIRAVGLEISYTHRLSARRPLADSGSGPTCIELDLQGPAVDISWLRRKFQALSRDSGIDIGIQEDTPYRRHRRLIAFDMDSTLIRTEVIDELARRAGVEGEVCRITERAMNGELDFKQSLISRVAQLKGLPRSELEQAAREMPLTEGAQRLIRNLKILGYKVAIISGGFTYFGRHLQNRLGIDYVFANELEIEDDQLTGGVCGEIVDGEKKAEILQYLADKENISLEQVIAVGDGANDLPMLNLAGLGIAFRAKPMVKEGAKQALSNVSLDCVLYFLGLRDREAMA
jgi:phosphoserine phosphatase